MKKLKYLSLIIGSLFIFSSCEKETEDISKVLHFTIQGEETILVPIGTEFSDPGFNITLSGKDVSNDVTVTQNVDEETVGLYQVKYVYRNNNTGEEVRTRTVIVCDPSVEADMSGEYTTQDGTVRTGSGSDVPFPGFKVTISKIAPGFFEISDFLGGYYEQRAAYGKAYACSGYVQLKSDNTFTLLSSSILPWGDTLTGVSDGVYNPNEQSISWSADYAGMTFKVVLK